MGQRNTQIIDSRSYEVPSEEYLTKLVGATSAANFKKDAKEIKDKFEEIQKTANQAKDEREKAYKLLNEAKAKKLLTQEEFKEKQKQIDKSLQELYKRPFGIPIVDETVGKKFISHKDKLAFVYVGDVAKANSDKESVNAPKIAMAVGGGLEFAYNPNTNQSNKIFPQNDSIEGVSAQFHLISLADIDVQGILPVSQLSNRSAITAKADILEFSANEVVLIRSLGTAYNSKGSRVVSPGGVHIVSGQTDGATTLKLEPMVLGDSLNAALLQLTEFVGLIISMLIDMNSDMLSLKTALMSHFHVATSIGSPTTPSIELIASIVPTIATKTALNITNGYSQMINLEMFKTNKLSSLSKEKFVSDFNRVN